MRRPLLATALAALALPVFALPAHAAVSGQFFPGDPIDSGVTRIGDIDVARDGTGGVVYVRKDGGVDHLFVSRFADGAFQAPERLDAALTGPASSPVIAASDGGRLAVAFVSDGTAAAVVKPAADQPWTGVQPLAAAGSNPAIDLSINGVGYATFTTTSPGGGDVHAARLDRRVAAFTLLPDVLDVAPERDAGTAAGRSRVSVAADGTALVGWGEAGHVFARRIFEQRLSSAPQDVAGDADAIDVALEDDSSFGWAIARQGPAVIARRLLGSTFEPALGLASGEPYGVPRLALSGRGDGFAGFTSAGGTSFGAVLKDDLFNPALALGAPVDGPTAPAVAYNAEGAIVYSQAGEVIARVYDTDPKSRAVTPPGPQARLARPENGVPDTANGNLVAAADRVGDTAIAFVQGADRKLVGATFDRAPGSFRGNTSTRFRNPVLAPLSWSQAFELWGPLTYSVFIDNVPVAQVVNGTSTKLAAAPKNGLHHWFVAATDRRGQSSRTPTRLLRVDGKPPKLRVGFKRSGRVVSVSAKASDASGTSAKASGMKAIRIDWGDGAKVQAAKASHRYGGKGTVTLTVTALDAAGNRTDWRRPIKRG